MESNKENEKKNRAPHFGGPIELICMTIMAIGIMLVVFVDLTLVKYITAGACAVVFAVPIILRIAVGRKGIDAEKICNVLKKRGLSPVVLGDEIRWTNNGKECVVRVQSRCQVVIAREYDLPSGPAAIEGNEKAALETMKEVYLAKVTVRENDGNNKLAFYTESLCTSAKEFSTYLPLCLEILDLAESRQKEHIQELRNIDSDNTAHKIGFPLPDGGYI